ncbi:PHP domain protein [Methanocaldococcus villosus KIN24-T80]|uniref:PHP domain protein n=1 Tax=Methanocaldococcus villosus KIN24-T80 TaxID=1069083 RepID=N6UWA7_9EURY|nr:PHP domain-containing protein [Methanocaldococcus villosus]ENN96584.1 PHP domain protein [Methanocaldococcus villosus KIN24-T80]
MKVDIHVHSINSKCSLNPKSLLRKMCKKYNLIPAVCDHNKLTKLDFAIPGEEVATNRGEFLALFIEEEIPGNLDIFEALDQVKEQGGLICIPHPFDSKRKRSLIKFNILEDREFLRYVDIVEVFNSRCRSLEPNIKAFEYAIKYNFPMGFGSDAHFIWELNNAYINFPELNIDKPSEISPKEFLNLLEIRTKEFLKEKIDLFKNPWKGKNHYGALGDRKNIEIYSKLLKKVRKILNI